MTEIVGNEADIEHLIDTLQVFVGHAEKKMGDWLIGIAIVLFWGLAKHGSPSFAYFLINGKNCNFTGGKLSHIFES